MSAGNTSLSYNASVGSSRADSFDDIDVIKVKNYVKDLLRSRVFLGRYLERRLTDQRVGYRDIVVLSAAEVDMKRDLFDAQNKLRSVCPNITWIGITDGDPLGYPSSVCLWTEIENQPFGPFWFQIKSIKFRDAEIIVTVKCLRHISDSYLEIEPILTGSGKKLKNDSATPSDCSAVELSDTYKEFVDTLKSALSIRNVKEFITFLCAFVIAVFTGSTAFINFLGNFILALIRETSILVKNSTPMFLGFLDFLSKIVGGFYILLAMFFKPSNPVPPQDRRTITYDQNRRTYDGVNNQYDRNFD